MTAPWSLALKNKIVHVATMVPPPQHGPGLTGLHPIDRLRQHLSQWMSGTTVARVDTIKNKRAMIKNFLRAQKESIQIIQKDKDRAVAFWMKRH